MTRAPIAAAPAACRRLQGALATALLLFAAAAPTAPAQQLRVESNIPDGFVERNFPLELRLDGALGQGERLAVLVGVEDVSALMAAVPGGFRYQAGLLPLPVGQSEVEVHRVDSAGAWHPVADFDLRVRSVLGVERSDLKPGFDLSFSAQPADGQLPEPTSPTEVPEVLDGKVQFDGELVHRDFTSTASVVLVGTSEKEQRLRYREMEGRAPLLDMASYRLDHAQGPVGFSLGHIRSGNQRHLLSGFGSRGAALSVTPSSRVELSMAANAGRQEVGWGNLLGIGEPDHRVLSANLGVEALSRPGALRVEVGWMDGSILPQSGFNRGAVTDAETSTGLSVRVAASGLDRRLSLDAGWARSTFDNPLDPELSQGFDLVEVEETTRTARYLEANLDLLRRVSVGGRHTASLSAGWQHERVDPLYRSVAASTRADVLQNQFDLRGEVAGVTVQASFASAEDNLDEISSILKTDTGRRSVSLGVPLTRIAGTAWAPSLQYRNDRTHQAGVGIPVDGGFNASHVPDQVSVNQSLSFDWRWSKVSFRYQLNHSDQDNRQEGREDADFTSLTSGFGLGLTPWRVLRLGVDLNLERADDLGRDARDNTRRWGVNATWQPLTRSSLALRFADTFQDDRAATKEQTGRTLDLKWSSRIPGADAVGGTWFVRYARRASSRIDRVRDLVTDRTQWSVTLGASLSWRSR